MIFCFVFERDFKMSFISMQSNIVAHLLLVRVTKKKHCHAFIA